MAQSKLAEARVSRIVQFTDCHLGADEEYQLVGVRTYHTFIEVLKRIMAEAASPDLVMVTGDIAAKGTPGAYGLFHRQMLASQLSYTCLPGNHDDFNLMQKNAGALFFRPVQRMDSWRLYSLNTAVNGEVGGYLSRQELDILDNNLTAEADNPAVIFMHHPPTNIGCQWLDRQQVSNGVELAQLLAGHKNVKAIFTGHVHQSVSTQFVGIPLFSTPSTCFQFTVQSQDFSVSREPPAYRWIDLYADGNYKTGIIQIDGSEETVDREIHDY